MAFVSAAAVANVCYAAPLAAEFARDFGVSEKSASLVTALSQVGYGLGILAVVPFGDLREQRKLVVGLLAAVSAGLVAAGFAPNIHFLAVAALFVGATTIIPQVLIPYAAALARPEQRSRVIATIQRALLMGVLLARAVAGEIAERWGWRSVFWISAGLMVILGVMVWFCLPAHQPVARATPVELVGSMRDLFLHQRLLRVYGASSALCYASFSVFWSTLAFLLAAPPHHYGPSVPGRFGFAGAAGALAVPLVARWSNRRGTHFTGGAGLAICLVSIPVFLAGRDSLLLLAAAVVLIDVGLQANHISNQTEILSLDATATSRLNGIYMFLRFVGGALGSVIGGWAWQEFGWPGVCAAGAGLGTLALLCHRLARRPGGASVALSPVQA
jgi:predicted MFS family arabinose efflux permease